MGQQVAAGLENEGDMVEALLAFNWWQERASGQLQEMGDMADFHKRNQEELEESKERYERYEKSPEVAAEKNLMKYLTQKKKRLRLLEGLYQGDTGAKE